MKRDLSILWIGLISTFVMAAPKPKDTPITPPPPLSTASPAAPAAAPTTPSKEWKDVKISEVPALLAGLQKSEDLSVDFKQKTFKKLRKRWVENSGSAWFKKPRTFRWAFKKPEAEEWIFDGKTLFHYFPEKKLAQKHPVEDQMSQELKTLVDMVLSFDALTKSYPLKSARRQENQLVLNFEPSAKSNIQGIETTVDLAQNALQSISIKSDNTTTFEFHNTRTQVLPMQTFELAKNIKVMELK
jgi:chaperone LolA